MEAVTVVARFRGAETGDTDFGEWVLTHNTIKHNEKNHNFNFDAVLDPTRSQSELYEAAGRKILSFFCDGYNATIFAYGQSGSGKTFSMLGPETVTEVLVNKSETIPPEVEEMFGMLPRATFHIFESIKEGLDKGSKFQVNVSYIEVYNEMINDILACPPGQNLKLREFPNQGMCVMGMQENVANTPEAVFEAISAGTANRIVCSTGQNARSSRSHTVFIISLEQVMIDGTVKKSKINLVDLAGSEKLSKTGAQGQALKEAQKINLSLTTLGRCIKALTSGGAEHVPYRESKLTLILKESLSGNAMTVLIVTGSMRKVHQEETISTMQFAERAKMVKTAAKSNAKRSYEELEKLVNKLTEEVDLLKKAIKDGRGGIITEMPQEILAVNSVELDELTIKYENLEETSIRQIEELKQALLRAESKMGNPEFVGLQEEIDSYKLRVEESAEQIAMIQQERALQKEEFEKNIDGLMEKCNEIEASVKEREDEVKKSHEELTGRKAKLGEKEAEAFKLQQEIKDSSKSEEKIKASISEMYKILANDEEKKNEIHEEIKKLNVALCEIESTKLELSGTLDAIKEESQDLLIKIQELEGKELMHQENIQGLKAQCERFREKIQKNRGKVEKIENDMKKSHMAYLQENDAILYEKQKLEQEILRIKDEIENKSKSLAEQTSEEVKEHYTKQVCSIFIEELARLQNEHEQSLHFYNEIMQKKHTYDGINQGFIKENPEIVHKIKEISEKLHKQEKVLEREKEEKNKTYLEFKEIEDSQAKCIEDAENKYREATQGKLLAFIHQENETKQEILRKQEDLQHYKLSMEKETNEFKAELLALKTEKFTREAEISNIKKAVLSKFEHFEEEKQIWQASVHEKSLEIDKLKEIIKSQQGKIAESETEMVRLEGDIKKKTGERETERKNSIIRQTLIPKRGSIFNKASSIQPVQEKGKLPAFILKKTDNKFLNDAIKEAEAIAKSSQANEAFKVAYEFQAIRALYGGND